MAVGLDERGATIPTGFILPDGRTVTAHDALRYYGVSTRADLHDPDFLTKTRLWAAAAYPFAIQARNRTSGDVRDLFTAVANLYISAYFIAEDEAGKGEGMLAASTLWAVGVADGKMDEALAAERAARGEEEEPPSPPAPDDPIPDPPPPEPTAEEEGGSILAWIAAGLGVLALGGGIAYAVTRKGRRRRTAMAGT